MQINNLTKFILSQFLNWIQPVMGIPLKYINIYYYNLSKQLTAVPTIYLFEHWNDLKLFNEVMLAQGASCIQQAFYLIHGL